ncbi:MAG: peptide-methionine (S)-S-oxide reductase MsrA, partial [Pseudomonadota bacterium]
FALILAAFAALASFAVTSAGAQGRAVEIQTAENTETAIFAGGCFWCVESDFDKVEGVLETVSGYTGGESLNPTYQSHKYDGHIEAVRITYDADIITYEEMVDYFFRHIDPTDAGGQFCDRGQSYTTAVFALNEDQANIARSEIENIEASGILPGSVVTPVRQASAFYPAEAYHQDYHIKAPLKYNFYRQACGRDARVREVWSTDVSG